MCYEVGTKSQGNASEVDKVSPCLCEQESQAILGLPIEDFGG